MATQLQLRRGTTAENDVFTGAVGELTMDTDTKGLRVHDGNTTGGFDVPVLVAVQRPTADNNYTWYRKYSDGWVEQGGIDNTGAGTKTITFPIVMKDANYTILTTTESSTASHNATVYNRATTSFTASKSNTVCFWQVSGMAA